jgi:hypothetical protein
MSARTNEKLRSLSLSLIVGYAQSVKRSSMMRRLSIALFLCCDFCENAGAGEMQNRPLRLSEGTGQNKIRIRHNNRLADIIPYPRTDMV